MRKTFLFLAALTIAVAANAFTLRMQNSDLGINKSLSEATDDPDFFGDGKVSVTFDAANNRVNVTLNNATLKGTNAQELFYFVGDDTYTSVVMDLIGKNYMIGEGNYSKPILVQDAFLYVLPEDPGNASLEISGKTLLIQANKTKTNAGLFFGSLIGDPFDLTITTTSSNQPVFYGSGAGAKQVALWFLAVNVTINASENNQVTQGFDMMACGGKIRTAGVTVKDGKTFAKDDADYKGNLVIVAPLSIQVGTTVMYPDEEFTPAEIKAGSLTYDKATRTVTLDNATIDGRLVVANNNATIYLKGANKFENTSIDTPERVYSMNVKITGDKDATLEIDGNNTCPGIYVPNGLEIGDFAKLTINNVTKGIVGSSSESETDVLTLNKTPMEIKSTAGVITAFENIVMAASGMEWSPAATYNTTTKALEDADGNMLGEVALTKVAAINNVVNNNAVSGKFIRNGQLLIEHNGELYNATGAKVK
ncbi:MAG: hypothetical protein IJQ95_06810 [Paludibacteraceae bacterium]|nr:hypothetical protein [Paludibacteraceae bacterium]